MTVIFVLGFIFLIGFIAGWGFGSSSRSSIRPADKTPEDKIVEAIKLNRAATYLDNNRNHSTGE
jgi:hypothetical protein